ncbi:MAG: hypothetical protein NTW29_20105 [Bacteroidetes bacterium]|nr:hypothetical protein [Bacteroidota bacterium]
MKITTLLFFLSLYQLCGAQVPDLTNWKIDTLPTGDRIYTANHSPDNWIFSKSGEKWEVVKNDFKRENGDSLPFPPDFIAKNLKEIRGNRYVKKTADGFLVGLNKGEFGGGLYFIKPDGLDGYEIARYLNIRTIFEYKSKYFAIEGLAHLGSERGQILEIFKSDTVWKYTSLTHLIEAPALITDYNNEKVIVTSQYLLKFGSEFTVSEILKSPLYWGVLYPSSILINNADIYLAMRKGVLKIKAFDTNPAYEWYTPK